MELRLNLVVAPIGPVSHTADFCIFALCIHICLQIANWWGKQLGDDEWKVLPHNAVKDGKRCMVEVGESCTIER